MWRKNCEYIIFLTKKKIFKYQDLNWTWWVFSLSFKSLPLIVGVVSPSWFMCHGWLHQSVFVQNHVHTPLIIRICLWNHVMAMVLTRLLNVFLRFSLEKIIISIKDLTHCHVVHYLLSYIVIWRIICETSILRIGTKHVTFQPIFCPMHCNQVSEIKYIF